MINVHGTIMKQKATKYSTSYSREFSEAEMKAAAKIAFLRDLGGDEGLVRRGLSESQIKITAYGNRITCTVTSRMCAIDDPTPIDFADFADDAEG